MILTRIPIPGLPAEISEAAYRWPMWVAGGTLIALTVVFGILIVMSILGKGNPKHDVARGLLTLALGAGILISVLAAAGLDDWTQDRYRDARLEQSARFSEIAEDISRQLHDTYDMRVEHARLRIFLRNDFDSDRAEATDSDGVSHDCMLYRSDGTRPMLTLECESPKAKED